jgi:hypothetical protein
LSEQQCIEELLEKGWVRDLLSKFKSKGKAVLKHLDFSFLNELIEQTKKTNRGRPPEYLPDAKLRGTLYCLASNTRKIRGMARLLKETLARLICGFQDDSPSASTLSRFFTLLGAIIGEVFHLLACFAASLGIFSSIFLGDTTSIEVSQDDPDGKWNYDSTKERWYYGYGLNLIIDWRTHLPVTAVFTTGKHVGDQEITEGITRMYQVKAPTRWIGDSEFDTKQTHALLMGQKTLPVIRYNPRNTADPLPVSFRVEHIVQEQTGGTVSLNIKQLWRDYRMRIEVEHSISTIKSLGLEHPAVKGYQAVKTYAFLILIYRLALGIYRYMEDPNANLREVTVEL